MPSTNALTSPGISQGIPESHLPNFSHILPKPDSSSEGYNTSTVRLLFIGYQEFLHFVFTVINANTVEERKSAALYGTTVWEG